MPKVLRSCKCTETNPLSMARFKMDASNGLRNNSGKTVMMSMRIRSQFEAKRTGFSGFGCRPEVVKEFGVFFPPQPFVQFLGGIGICGFQGQSFHAVLGGESLCRFQQEGTDPFFSMVWMHEKIVQDVKGLHRNRRISGVQLGESYRRTTRPCHEDDPVFF